MSKFYLHPVPKEGVFEWCSEKEQAYFMKESCVASAGLFFVSSKNVDPAEKDDKGCGGGLTFTSTSNSASDVLGRIISKNLRN